MQLVAQDIVVEIIFILVFVDGLHLGVGDLTEGFQGGLALHVANVDQQLFGVLIICKSIFILGLLLLLVHILHFILEILKEIIFARKQHFIALLFLLRAPEFLLSFVHIFDFLVNNFI